MSHLITYVRREGQEPITVNAPGYDERTIRTMAGALAALSRRVTLSRVDDDGIPEPIGRWVNGKPSRELPGKTIPPIEPTVIDHEDGEDENILADAEAAQEYLDDAETDQTIVDAAAESDENGETHSAYCMKCHEKRDVTGHVEVSANGRRQFRGPCPVCGTNVFRFLPSDAAPVEPEPEWSDEDETAEAEETPRHTLIREDRPRGKVRLACSCDEWETTVTTAAAETRALAAFSEHAAEEEDEGEGELPTAEDVQAENAPMPIHDDDGNLLNESEIEEWRADRTDEDGGADAAAELAGEIIAETAEAAPEGTPIAELAEAAEVAAVTFSDAAEEAEKAKPAKKAPAKKATTPRKRTAKATDENGRTPNQKAAANPTKGFCPNCESEVDIIERAGLKIYTVHPDQKRGLDRCSFSTSVVGG